MGFVSGSPPRSFLPVRLCFKSCEWLLVNGFSLNEEMGWKVEQTKKPHQGVPLILDVREVGSEFIRGGVEEWEGEKEN